MADWDITLDGADYMVQPKSYKASTTGDDAVAASIARTSPGHPSSQLGLGSFPHVWPWQGYIGPAPERQAISGTIESATTRIVMSDSASAYVISNDELYSWTRAIASAAVSIQTTANPITCAALLNGNIYLGFGTLADVDAYDISTDVLLGAAAALGVGVKASMLHEWARGILLVSPTFPENLHYYHGTSLTYKRSWKLAGRIISIANHVDRAVIVTDAGLYELTGDWWQDADPPAPEETLTLSAYAIQPGNVQASDDGRWLLSYAGRLWGWFGGQVLRLDNVAGTWLPAGLVGAETHGACVVNNWLIVSITSLTSSSTYQLWAYDGDAWYLIEQVSTNNTLDRPQAAGDSKLVVFHAANTAWATYDLGDVLTATTLRTPWTYQTQPLDAGDAINSKDWTGLGVEFYRPDGQAVGNWSASLEYSTDGGATWTVADTATINTRQQTMSATIAVSAVRLLARVVLSQTSGLPPLIASVWTEATTAGSSALRRRRWEFKCRAADVLINRAGAGDSRTGEQIADALWADWSSGAAVGYTDPAGDAYTVRVTKLVEDWDAPAQQPDSGRQSTLTVSLEETS